MAETHWTLLLVEDEQVTAHLHSHLLRHYGYHVVVAVTGDEAVHKALDPDVDLILMDIDLGSGSIDGTEAACRILERRDIPVLFLSSHTERDVVARTEEITSYGYVVKNAGIVVLDASIKMALRLFQSTQDLQKSRQDFQDLFELNADAIVIARIDEQNAGAVPRIIAANPALEKMTGYGLSEVLGSPVDTLEGCVTPEVTHARIEALRKTGELRFETVIHTREKRAVCVDVRAKLIRYRDTTAVMNVVRDVSWQNCEGQCEDNDETFLEDREAQ